MRQNEMQQNEKQQNEMRQNEKQQNEIWQHEKRPNKTQQNEIRRSESREAAAWIDRYKIITIVRGIAPTDCAALAEALYAGGIRLMEITFDQREEEPYRSTVDTIDSMVNMWKGRMCIGAGTVLTREQLHAAREAGAGYIVTPNTDPAIIREAGELDMAVLAGAMTPSEVVTAYGAGADFVKLFPASCLGPAYVKAIRAPLSHIPMLAVGGVDEKNLRSFLDAGMCGAGVGGKLVNKEWIREGAFDRITALARQYVKIAEEAAEGYSR